MKGLAITATSQCLSLSEIELLPYEAVTTMWGKKTAQFYFCNSFVRTSSITTIFGTHILQ